MIYIWDFEFILSPSLYFCMTVKNKLRKEKENYKNIPLYAQLRFSLSPPPQKKFTPWRVHTAAVSLQIQEFIPLDKPPNVPHSLLSYAILLT